MDNRNSGELARERVRAFVYKATSTGKKIRKAIKARKVRASHIQMLINSDYSFIFLRCVDVPHGPERRRLDDLPHASFLAIVGTSGQHSAGLPLDTLAKVAEVRDVNKFIGQVAIKPERRDGKWYFSIWNTKTNQGINCSSSARFEAENINAPLDLNPRDEVEVIGDVQMHGTCSFDQVTVLRPVS